MPEMTRNEMKLRSRIYFTPHNYKRADEHSLIWDEMYATYNIIRL